MTFLNAHCTHISSFVARCTCFEELLIASMVLSRFNVLIAAYDSCEGSCTPFLPPPSISLSRFLLLYSLVDLCRFPLVLWHLFKALYVVFRANDADDIVIKTSFHFFSNFCKAGFSIESQLGYQNIGQAVVERCIQSSENKFVLYIIHVKLTR